MLENLTNEEDQHKRNVTSLIGDYGNKLEPSTIKIIYGINIPCVEFWYAREVSTLTGGISKHEQEKRWIRPIN